MKAASSGTRFKKEQVLWSQVRRSSDSFTGELTDNRGNHLFNFSVNGSVATIKAISAGYIINLGGEGSTVVVADGENLGIIESSAYPEDPDNENFTDGSIIINSASYLGMRGTLNSLRSSALITAPKILLNYPKGTEIKTHSNGSDYIFHPQKGQRILAYKDVILVGDQIDLSHSTVQAGQSLQTYNLTPGVESTLSTYGSNLQAGYCFLSHTHWRTDTALTFAGMPQYDPYAGTQVSPALLIKMSKALTPNTYQTRIDIDRIFAYWSCNIYVLNEEEFKQLAAGPHIFGVYKYPIYTQPQLTMYTLPPAQPVYTRDRYNDGFVGFGAGSHGSGGRQTSTSSFAPPATTALQAMIQRVNNSGPAGGSIPMPNSNLTVKGVEFAAGTRAGASSISASIDLTSSFAGNTTGSNTIGFNYTGHSVNMFSQYTPPSMEEAIRMGVQGINPTGPNLALATHGIASQLITQLADGSKKLNMTNTLRMAWVAGSAVVGAILLQDAKNKTDAALDAKDRQSASAAAPGMPPEDPNEDPNGDRLKKKLSELQSAQKKAVREETLPDGRIRYYNKERLATTPGLTRGSSRVVEHNPRTGNIRSWEESYNHKGEVIRVHPETINGQDIQSIHYPLTGKEMAELLK